jgi:hypothetical protein
MSCEPQHRFLVQDHLEWHLGHNKKRKRECIKSVEYFNELGSINMILSFPHHLIQVLLNCARDFVIDQNSAGREHAELEQAASNAPSADAERLAQVPAETAEENSHGRFST